MSAVVNAPKTHRLASLSLASALSRLLKVNILAELCSRREGSFAGKDIAIPSPVGKTSRKSVKAKY